MWMMIAGLTSMALSGAAGAMSQASSEKFRLEQEAQKAKHQANMSKLAAGTTAYERNLAMRSLENQAMAQGLADGITMSKNNVAQSSTGVALASKSKYMGMASQRLMHVINQANMEINRVTTLGNLEAKKVGQMGDAIIHNANAKTNSMLGDAINVSQAGWMSLLGTVGQAAMTYGMSSAAGEAAGSAKAEELKNSGGQKLGSKKSSNFGIAK